MRLAISCMDSPRFANRRPLTLVDRTAQLPDKRSEVWVRVSPQDLHHKPIFGRDEAADLAGLPTIRGYMSSPVAAQVEQVVIDTDTLVRKPPTSSRPKRSPCQCGSARFTDSAVCLPGHCPEQVPDHDPEAREHR